MAIIARSMLGLIAPILTYTADEIFENAPAVIKGDASDIFDITYSPIDPVESDWAEDRAKLIRESFNEIVDGLKKEKVIKNTLELVISTDMHPMFNKADIEEFLVISKWCKCELNDILGTFNVEGWTFKVAKATKAKCPRCWKYHSVDEETVCERCASVVGV
jgi:isoleucyl-tRNA synthetase